jgi:hypothetical protein
MTALNTTRFNIQIFYLLPTQYILCFVWFSEQAMTVSLYNINLLVFYNHDKSVLTVQNELCL